MPASSMPASSRSRLDPRGVGSFLQERKRGLPPCKRRCQLEQAVNLSWL